MTLIPDRKIQNEIKSSAQKNTFQTVYTYYMSFIGVLGQFVFYAQAMKIFQTKSAKDVSMFGFMIGLIAVTSWFFYGIIIKNKPLVISNLVAIGGAIFVVVGIYIYG